MSETNDSIISVSDDVVIYTNCVHQDTPLRVKEMDERVPRNGQVGQVLVWGDNGPQWVYLT